MIFSLMATLLGIDIGFWIGMAVCLVIVIVMNAVYWHFPDRSKKHKHKKEGSKSNIGAGQKRKIQIKQEK